MNLNLLNGSHRPQPYFEWWYFHFVIPNGPTINMVLHETDIFGRADKPYVSLSALFPQQTPQYLRQSLDRKPIKQRQPRLQVGEGMFQEDEQALYFDVPFHGRGYFRGQVHKLAAPLAINNGILYASNGRCSYWVVNIPHGRFTAVLCLDGQLHQLNGFAYQDHQWGTLCIQEFVSDWVWGHFSNEATSITFFQMLTKQGQLIERVGWGSRAGQYTGTAINSNYLHQLMQTPQLEQFDSDAAVSFCQQLTQLKLHISPNNMMRTRFNEVQGNVTTNYVRWAAEGQLTHCDDQTLHGITEYIQFRPTTYDVRTN